MDERPLTFVIKGPTALRRVDPREDELPPRSEDNFNLNKRSRGRHLCPCLVLFMPDYSKCTCAAVSSAGRMRWLVSCQCFLEPTRYTYLPGILSVFPTSSGCSFLCPLSSSSSSFALIYAITDRNAPFARQFLAFRPPTPLVFFFSSLFFARKFRRFCTDFIGYRSLLLLRLRAGKPF